MADFDYVWCDDCGANLGRGFFMESCPCCGYQLNDSSYFYDDEDEWDEEDETDL